jgi:alpha-D-xyloside xylohydrolase
MKNKKSPTSNIIFTILTCIICISCNTEKYQEIQSGIIFDLDSIRKRILFYDDNIVRVSATKKGNPFIDNSLAVNAQPKDLGISVSEKERKIVLSTKNLILEIDKQTGAIQYFNIDKRHFLNEHPTIKPVLKDTNIYNKTYYHIKQPFELTEKEGIYGFGQFQNGIMNYRNRDLVLVQDNKIAIVPMMISTNNYGILWDNYSHSQFHDGDDGTWFTGEVADQIDYYFMGGENMDDVIRGYRFLTGKAPLFPKKAYGFWQSKERYKSFDELHEVVQKYRDNNIPIDNIVQDWRYWGDNSKWSSMYFEPEHFPNPTENIEKLHDANVNLMISIWPAVGKQTKLYKELDENDLLLSPLHFSGGRVYDAYSQNARDIYWKHVENGLIKHGVDAFWMDGTEPQFINLRSQMLFKEELLAAEQFAIGPVSKYLNTFALVTSENIYENFRDVEKEKRAFILTRSSWAGQQRNATVTWSGDVAANFTTLKKQISAGINFCMAGVPYWTHDIGAFFPGGFGGLYYDGIEEKAYQELYVRWFQFGAFSPIFRSHGTGTPREVWQFKERNPEYYNALIQTDELRYRLMPYIYSNAWQITKNDYTLMRGLPMDFANDMKVLDIVDQYMFGPFLLIKPITKEMFHHVDTFPELIDGDNVVGNANDEGMLLTIFHDTTFQKVATSQKVGAIDNNWIIDIINPPGITTNNFSAIWESTIRTDENGTHEIVVEANDAIKVTIDGESVIERWNTGPLGMYRGRIDLNAGNIYDLKVETYQTGQTVTVRLGWVKPSEKKGNVELSNLASTYLPATDRWYDFWDGQDYDGGQVVNKDYSIATFPLYVKAGAIIPMKPVQQYVDQIPDAPIYLRIYEGANAEFILYEDEGDTYNYEKGDYSEIPIRWDEQGKKLTIGERKGEYPGMIIEREFKVIWVKENHGVGITSVKNPDMEIIYNGERIEILK